MPDKANLALNLTSLCKDFASISSVCRQLKINRQQFNKYLSGSVVPSPFNMARICRFFRISEHQLYMTPAEFDRSRLEALENSPAEMKLAAQRHDFYFPNDEAGQLDRYLGYYFTYYRSPSFPNSIFRSIIYIFKKDNFVYSKLMERYLTVYNTKNITSVGKEYGKVSYIDDRIYIAESVKYLRRSVSLTVLYPTYRAQLDILSGVLLSVSSGAGRQPFASRVVFEYMGVRPNLRSMISRAGIYPQDSTEIREEIRVKCQNTLDDDILRAVHY